MSYAIKAVGDEWVYIVLTFARESFESVFEAYRGLYHCWDKLRSRFIRKWDRLEYISLAEQHRDGFPHLNVLVCNKALWKACSEEGWREVRKWLELNAVECGFGFRTWVEQVRSDEAIAGYFVKLCSEVVSKPKELDQTPTEAPPHFRRLRTSRGLLPKVYHNKGLTGKLVQKSIEELQQASQVYDVMAKRFKEELKQCQEGVGSCLVEK